MRENDKFARAFRQAQRPGAEFAEVPGRIQSGFDTSILLRAGMLNLYAFSHSPDICSAVFGLESVGSCTSCSKHIVKSTNSIGSVFGIHVALLGQIKHPSDFYCNSAQFLPL
ncbi:MAG: hypothetical protein H6696_03075 [Deferribacteres bacterium]|nr:hypothetical protein [candidate division KSB1 bacterium]MCB9500898.1 hypothetical protein [Deferribacteres bacterium]